MTKKQLELEVAKMNEELNCYRLANLKLIIKHELPKRNISLTDYFQDMVITAEVKNFVSKEKKIYSEKIPDSKIKKIIFEGNLKQLMAILNYMRKVFYMIEEIVEEEALEHFFIKGHNILSQDIYTSIDSEKIKCSNKTALGIFVKCLSEIKVISEHGSLSDKNYLHLGRNIFSKVINHFCNYDGEDFDEKNNFSRLVDQAKDSERYGNMKIELEKILNTLVS